MDTYQSRHTGAQIDAAVDAVLNGEVGGGGSVELTADSIREALGYTPVKSSGWSAGKNLGTDEDGNVIEKEDIFSKDTSAWSPVEYMSGVSWTGLGYFWQANGTQANTEYTQQYQSTTELIRIEPNCKYTLSNFRGVYFLYDASGKNGTQSARQDDPNTPVSFTTAADRYYIGISHAPTGAYTVDRVSLVRTNISQAEYDALPTRADSLKPLYGKKVVCFGDSLFGMYRGEDSAPAFVAGETGATVYNVGFGGCRMAVHPTSGYGAFSMWALAKAIAENDWTDQDAQASSGSAYFPEQLALLKTIDFNAVDIAVIHYGTNDFASGNGVPIDNASDPDDYSSLCGALRYSIDKLLGAYPKLRIYVSLPVYRFWTDDSGVTTYAETYLNTIGKTLPEFVEALRGVAAEYNLPVIDGYYGLGINKANAATFLSDGTHHNVAGRERFGRFIGANLTAQQNIAKSHAADSGTSEPGAAGEDGGYYTPSVEQTNTTTMRVSFAGSKADMPSISPVDVTLPQGPQGEAGKDADSIPEYVRTEAEAVARTVNQHQSGDSIVFPFLTDAHCGYYTDKTNEATKLAGQLLKLIGQRTPFDFIVNGGDMANGAYDTTRAMSFEQIEDYTELTSDAQRAVPAVWVPGNHDDAPYMATADRATQRDVFALIGRKNRLSGAVCPNGCNYGYLDLDNRHLRVIYLDTDDKRSWGTVQVGSGGTAPAYLNAHNVSGEQLRWLADTALDFSGKDNAAKWGIVVVSHVALDASGTITDAVSGTNYAHNTANAATILTSYQVGGGGSISHNGVQVDFDFSELDARASVICCVHGHNHKFTHGTVGGILSIGCPNVMNGRERESADGTTYTKTAGTADGTSFCILTIDRESNLIYADCVGAGYDREFEYTTEVVSYTNWLPISTDASGAVYNGKGWKKNTYLSSGNDGTYEGIYASGFIPLEWNEYGNAVLHCKNVGMQTGQNYHRISLYDADKTHIETVKTTVTSGWWTWGSDGNIEKITVLSASYSTAKYIRLCCGYLGDDSIITVNEEIV